MGLEKITKRETSPLEHSSSVNLAFVLWQQQNSITVG